LRAGASSDTPAPVRICAPISRGVLALTLVGCAPRATVSGDETRRLSDEADPRHAAAEMDSVADAGASPATEAAQETGGSQEAQYERALAQPTPLRAPGNVVFPPGPARLPDTEATRAALEQAARFLTDHPDLALRVEGHSDSKGKPAQNLEVSGKRALLVKAWLLEHGIGRERLVAVGHGGQKPIATNGTPGGRAQNRRVEFVIASGSATAPDDGSGTVFE
jgi:outer membrane protein OmpA-like peptidoglycan-associated protein